jgi:hypothetical protein
MITRFGLDSIGLRPIECEACRTAAAERGQSSRLDQVRSQSHRSGARCRDVRRGQNDQVTRADAAMLLAPSAAECWRVVLIRLREVSSPLRPRLGTTTPSTSAEGSAPCTTRRQPRTGRRVAGELTGQRNRNPQLAPALCPTLVSRFHRDLSGIAARSTDRT